MIYIGKDLEGNELGKGIDQRKDGRYRFKKVVKGKSYSYYSWSLDDIKEYRKDFESLMEEKRRKSISKLLRDKGEIIDDKEGYIYFISDGQYCKIGRTKNLKRRLSAIQSGNPQKLTLMYSIKANQISKLEKSIHKLFSKYHVHGEWYDILFLFQEDEIEEAS